MWTNWVNEQPPICSLTREKCALLLHTLSVFHAPNKLDSVAVVAVSTSNTKQKNKKIVGIANCVDLKQKRIKEKNIGKYAYASRCFSATLYHAAQRSKFIHSCLAFWFFACVSDYRMSASDACKSMREKKICCGSKRNRMAFVAHSVDAYLRAKYFMFWCSRGLMARPRDRATARPRVYVFSVEHAFWHCLHIQWWTFVNLCENSGWTHSPRPGRACRIRYRGLGMNKYVYKYICTIVHMAYQ